MAATLILNTFFYTCVPAFLDGLSAVELEKLLLFSTHLSENNIGLKSKELLEFSTFQDSSLILNEDIVLFIV